jgi:hypothetical protein
MKTKISLLLLAIVAFIATSCEPINGPKNTPYFSVSPKQKVVFSPGNLQYKASTKEWRFAPSQYNYIGENNIKISDTYSGWIDLFGWGTGHKPTLKSNQNSDYDRFVDWGANSINGDPFHTWRTLSIDEWNYLILNRPKARTLIGVAQVNNVNGLILLPDNWVAPDSISFISGMHEGYMGSGYSHQTFSAEQWRRLEQNGAVFLPAAGMRIAKTAVAETQKEGYYWTATIGPDPCFLYFRDGQIYTYSVLIDRSTGKSVRLVKNL